MLRKEHNNIGYLEGNLLVATPLLNGSAFEKAVIYLCAHNEIGSMGILINHAINNLKYIDILTQVGINSSEINFKNTPVYCGGPIESAKGFILHTSDYYGLNTQVLHDNISLTSTIDILQDMASGRGPHKRILALGCAGWEAGQLEKEIKENAWITIPATETIMFDADDADKWYQATNSLGINNVNYSYFVGNA